MGWRGPRLPREYPTLGQVAIDWIEGTLRLPDGPRRGEPVQLYEEQQKHLLRRYRLDPDAPGDLGNDAFVHGGSMLVRGQKWGKDPLLAMVSLFHAYGPCDFAGWDVDGEPVGMPAATPWVAIAATNDDQTNNTWLPLLEMVKTSDLALLPGGAVFDTYIRLPCGNPIEVLTTTAWGRMGGRFTHVSLTETGLLIGDGRRGGLTFARTLKRNVGGMNGMWMAATNTWDPTERSDAQLTYEAHDPHVFVDIRLARRSVPLGDERALREELAHVYGDSLASRGGHVSMQRLLRECRNKANGESEVRRFYLCEIVAGRHDAVDPAVWDARERESDLRTGQKVALGFDGSRARDATALVACRLEDGRLFKLGCWLPEEHKGHKIPRELVHDSVAAAFEAYDVAYLFADPYLWQDALDTWQGKWEGRVVDFPTNVETRMDAALERFLTGLRDGELTHEGDEELTEHAKATALAKGKRKPAREDAVGQLSEFYLKPVKKREGMRIDLFVAAVLAYAARGKAIEDGALNPQEEVAPWVAYV